MDDLEVYRKDKAEIESLVSTVQLISQDMRMEFGIKEMWCCSAEAGVKITNFNNLQTA